MLHESQSTRPPIIAGANKAQTDIYDRSKQAGNAQMNILAANQSQLNGNTGFAALGGALNPHIENRQRANSFNYTGAFAASK